MKNTPPASPEAAAQPDPWATIKEKFPLGSVVTGTVRHLTDYGAFVQLSPGIDGMIHISAMSHKRIEHPSELVSVGQKLEVMILDIKKSKRRIELGLKQLTANWDSVKTKFAVGQKVKGKIVRLTHVDLVVELESGVVGVVPGTEISWANLKTDPRKGFTKGEEVTALVLGFDCQKRRLSLTIRQLEPDPWIKAETKFPVGARVKGTVRSMKSYGAFVELDEGICGMVHVSNMSWMKRINHPSEFLKQGDEVEAIVLKVDPAERRVELGIKQLVRDPWEIVDQLYKVGDLVQGRVVKLATFGAFVELQPELHGLVHISRISEQPVDKVRNVLEVGQDVSVRIIKIDRDEKRIGLTMLLKRDG